MKNFKAKVCPYSVCLENKTDCDIKPYPLLRCAVGNEEMRCISPIHGRSYVVGQHSDGRYVISKGNGLNYSTHLFLNTGEMGIDTWGLLLRKDAIRDFTLGQEIAELGIRTNKMEYVLELDVALQMPQGDTIKPYLLQYSVECPYRITDAAFMSIEEIDNYTSKWENLNSNCYQAKHLIAADVMIRNLQVLHSNSVLHNAIQESNYTWGLELLDFELACSPLHPYDREDYRRHALDLFPRELTQTYSIINYIAAVLNEEIDYSQIENIFNNYNFDFQKFNFYCPLKGNFN